MSMIFHYVNQAHHVQRIPEEETNALESIKRQQTHKTTTKWKQNSKWQHKWHTGKTIIYYILIVHQYTNYIIAICARLQQAMVKINLDSNLKNCRSTTLDTSTDINLTSFQARNILEKCKGRTKVLEVLSPVSNNMTKVLTSNFNTD